VKNNLGMGRNLALALFAFMSLASPLQAEARGRDCYNCGSCVCCDDGSRVACSISCSRGYCNCCGYTCTGDACN
jgi:hypothetical protein